MSDNRLKSIADRINRLMDEREAIGADIRDIYAEAKGVGYIPKALRKVIARLRMDPDKLKEDDTLVELYEAALGPVGKAMEAVRQGATWEEAGKATGVPRATLARAEAVSKRREMIPEAGTESATVVATANLDGLSPNATPLQGEDHNTTGGESETRTTVPMQAEGRASPFLGDDPGEPHDAIPDNSEGRPRPGRILPSAAAWQAITSVREAHHARIEAEREARRLKREQENAHAARLALITDADMPNPPPFLRRSAA